MSESTPGSAVAAQRRPPIVVGVTGASGAVLARRCIERLLELDCAVELVATSAARIVWRQEIGCSWSDDVQRWAEQGAVVDHPINDHGAAIASGSYPTRGMLIAPCSMGTVAALAAGLANNLLLRVADVTQKEGRRLVLVPRETPLSTIHLENLLRLAQRAARIVPPMPNFYKRPQSLEEIVDFVAARALLAMEIAEQLPDSQQWQGLEAELE